jgi:arylsulfatase A-like enzyme
LTSWRRAAIDGQRQRQYETLLAVDRGVAQIVDALRKTGRLNHTMFVFTSDNGLAWGEHRWNNKISAYEESIRVPLVIRYDPLTSAPRVETHLALNIDLAPTWAQIADVAPPGVDGSSLVQLLKHDQRGWRTNFLVEDGTIVPGHYVPKYCAVRSYGYLYAAYSTGEEELYSLRSDPYELKNRAHSKDFRAALLHYRRRLRVLCDPPPPGYVVQH